MLHHSSITFALLIAPQKKIGVCTLARLRWPSSCQAALTTNSTTMRPCRSVQPTRQSHKRGFPINHLQDAAPSFLHTKKISPTTANSHARGQRPKYTCWSRNSTATKHPSGTSLVYTGTKAIYRYTVAPFSTQRSCLTLRQRPTTPHLHPP